MKGIVIYSGRYGSTRRYAIWLATDLGFECVESEKAKPDPEAYDTIVLGAAVYYGRWLLARWLNHHQRSLEEKNLYAFSVSLLGGDPDQQDKFFKASVPESLRGRLKLWHLGGRVAKSRLGVFHRLIFWLVQKFSKDNGEVSECQKLDRDEILPLLEAIKSGS